MLLLRNHVQTVHSGLSLNSDAFCALENDFKPFRERLLTWPLAGHLKMVTNKALNFCRESSVVSETEVLISAPASSANRIVDRAIQIEQEHHEILNIPEIVGRRALEKTLFSSAGFKEIVMDMPGPSLSEASVQMLENIFLILARNFVSVGGATAAREFLRELVIPFCEEKSPSMVLAAAGGTLALPVALQLLGLARDFHAGTQTKETLYARVANIVLGILTAAGLMVSGGFVAAAASLICAVLVYVPLRELSQYFLCLRNNNAGSGIRASCCAASAYVLNQSGVGMAMDRFVSGSAMDIFIRSGLNVMGESADEIINAKFNANFNALSQGNAVLKYELGIRKQAEMTKQTMGDQVLNLFAPRAGLFGAACAGTYAASAAGIVGFPLILVFSALLGVGYVPFVYTSAQQAPVANELVKSDCLS